MDEQEKVFEHWVSKTVHTMEERYNMELKEDWRLEKIVTETLAIGMTYLIQSLAKGELKS